MILIDIFVVLSKQGQLISLTGLLARVSLKQLKIEFYWLMLPAVIGIYIFTKTINFVSLAESIYYEPRQDKTVQYKGTTAM